MLLKAQAIQDQLTAWRRDFHMHPELGFQETRTAARVAEICEAMGCRVRREVGRTGVVADLGSGSPRIAIRADMDALPIQEADDRPYCSQHPGKMHACGHDAHTAIALGVALLLSREQFPGSVRFLFQPSEEVGDEEGISGAPRMIADGALDGVDMVLALHVDPATAVGDICVEAGPSSGGVDSWFAAVIGKGCHGAFPHRGVDPFYLTAQVILALNAIVSRRLHPFDPAVVSIGSVHGGQAQNVIPERVELSGTLRYMEKRVQEQIHAEMRRAFEVARALGGDYDLRFEIGVPPMYNHPVSVDLIRAAATEVLGAQHVLPFEKELGAEDFGCFLEIVPGAMFSLGTRIAGDERLAHTPRFDIDERALPIGVAVLAEAALRFLRARAVGE